MKLTQAAINKVVEIIRKYNAGVDDGTVEGQKACGFRALVTGGGCSGFQYGMGFETDENGKLLDDITEYEGRDSNGQEYKLKVFVDAGSLLYLEKCEIDYVETLEKSGFKFNNPDEKSTCGCGSSFSV